MHTNVLKNISSIHILLFLEITHWAMGMDILPNRNFPLVFQSVDGECERDAGSTSHFNSAEADAVLDWIEKLLKTKWNDKEVCLADIGIVSPYKTQCNLIREKLEDKGYEDISVGTAETYQGRERQIMMISTVRTGNQLGFVSDEQVRSVSWCVTPI